jgi:hypothetical protein
VKRNRREAIDATLDALYDTLPPLECKGLCAESCGPIECSTRERERIAERGVRLPTMAEVVIRDRAGETLTCPALRDGRCSVYEVRPMICRIWGATAGLPCPHGCRPVRGARMLPDAVAYGLLDAALNVGGWPGGSPRAQAGQLREWAELHPEVVARFLADGHDADVRRAVRS